MNEIAQKTKLSMEYMKAIRTHHEQCNTCDFDRLYELYLAKKERKRGR